MFLHQTVFLLSVLVILNTSADAPKEAVHAVPVNTIRVGLLHGDPEPFTLPLAVLREAFLSLNPPAKIELVDISEMNQKRALKSMMTEDAPFDIFFSGFSAEREQDLLQIDVPLTMGLLGARVLVVNENREYSILHNTKTEAELRKLRIGSGTQWPDTSILLFNQFNVVQSSYQGLWKMLSNRRIDAFARGIEEAFVEVEQRRNNKPTPKILNNWLLVYPLDYFVYLSPNNTALYQQLSGALQKAHVSGKIAEVISSEPSAKKALHWLKNAEYSTVYLHNSLLSERVRSLPEAYWLPEVRP